MSDVDLSWMNVPGPDGLTWAQKYANAPRTGLEWMNAVGPDGLTFVQRFQQNRLPGQTPVAPPATPGTTQQKNAFAIIQEQLRNFGLGDMADKTWKYILDNGVEDENRTLLWLYEQPEFKRRFPALEALQKKYRGIQPAQYIQLEKQYAQVMRGAGLSANFFDDPNDFTSLIENDVSQAEFQERIDGGFRKVAQADPAVRNAFRQYFGVEGDAALAAFFIDPERSAPKLTKAAQMAELGGAASTMGVKINADYAEKLTRLGVSQQQALAGFQKMQQQRGLFETGIGETSIETSIQKPSDLAKELKKETSIGAMAEETQAGIDYTFGTDVAVQRQLELRLRQRKAQSSGVSQQVATNRQGRTAVGTAD